MEFGKVHVTITTRVFWAARTVRASIGAGQAEPKPNARLRQLCALTNNRSKIALSDRAEADVERISTAGIDTALAVYVQKPVTRTGQEAYRSSV